MPKPQLRLYVDLHSPFAYMAFIVTKNSPIFKNCDVTYVPVYLVGIIKACDNTPPWGMKNKPEWLQKERMLWARKFNIPMAEKYPEGFPTTTAKVQRALCAVTLLCPDRLSDALAALYDAFWVQGKAIHTSDVFQPVLERALGADLAREITQLSMTDEVRHLLSANTQRAMDDGAFGLPWFVATKSSGQKECFWGFDHLGQVVDFLGLDRASRDHKGWSVML